MPIATAAGSEARARSAPVTRSTVTISSPAIPARKRRSGEMQTSASAGTAATWPVMTPVAKSHEEILPATW
jgi:hypothetical protein